MRSSRFRSVLSLCAGTSLLLFSFSNPSLAKTAEIRVPDGWAAAATRIEFRGFGGFNRGEFSGSVYRGEFQRSESRLGIFDPLYVKNRAGSAFSMRGDDRDSEIHANCRMERKTAAVKVVTLDLKKMSYVCNFSGTPSAAEWSFVIGEPRRKGLKEQFMAYERRLGEASIAGVHMTIRSIHEYHGSPLGSQAPLGYSIESAGAQIAAVDLLDWNPIVHVRNDLTTSERESAVVVALALAVLRDPAHSALEE